MATPYTVAQLQTAIRERIGYDGTTVVTDAQLLKMINDVIHDLWDVLIQNDIVDSNVDQQVTVSGTSTYTLVDGAYRLKRVGLIFDGLSYPLETFELGDAPMWTSSMAWGPGFLPRYRTNFLRSGGGIQITFTPPPGAAYSFNYWYVQEPPQLVGGDAAPNILANDIYPFGEYVILECAIRCMRALRRDAGELMADRDRYLQRLELYGQPMQKDRAPMALRTKPIAPWGSGRRWR